LDYASGAKDQALRDERLLNWGIDEKLKERNKMDGAGQISNEVNAEQ